MITLPGIASQDTRYESVHALVDRSMRDKGLTIVIKRLQKVQPSSQAITRYRQKDVIAQPERSRQDIQLVPIGGSHRRSQGALSAMCEEAA